MGTDPLGKSSSRQTSQSRDLLLVSFATYVVLNEAFQVATPLRLHSYQLHGRGSNSPWNKFHPKQRGDSLQVDK